MVNRGGGEKRAERLADEELMARVGDREPEALAVLYDRHGAAAFSLAYRMVGERQAAEDVTQEAFISIWRNGGRFDAARGSARSWLLSIVRYRAIDRMRARGAKTPKLDQDDESVLEQRPSEWLIEEEVERSETAMEVHDVLRILPREQSSTIELAYFGGFSQAQIAGLLDVPLGTVKGRMRLGLEKIRREMTGGAA